MRHLLWFFTVAALACDETGSENSDNTEAGADGGGDTATGDTHPPPEPDVRVTVDANDRSQTLVGFGASVGWFHLSFLDHPQHREIADIVFKELGLDVLRLRNQYQRLEPEERDLVEDGEVLQAAALSLGHPPIVILSSWSPSAHLKENGHEECSGNEDCTLIRRDGAFDYAGFADWWRQSLEAYREVGVVPDYISIQNEPDFIPGGWEGCRFEPGETDQYPGYNLALQAVHAALLGTAAPPKILAPEVLGVHWSKPRSYVDALDLSLVDGIAHHLYEMGNDGVWDWRDPGPDSFIDEMEMVSFIPGGLPLFQTEFQTDEDNNIEGGFETAWLIHNSLAFEGVSAFLYWDLIWRDRGLVSLIENNTAYRIRDQYYAMRHYSRFTDPGYIRVGASSPNPDIRSTAFVSPAGDATTVVLLNIGSEAVTVGVNLGEVVPVESGVFRTVYAPGSSTVWEDLGPFTKGPIPMPPRSQVTVMTRH